MHRRTLPLVKSALAALAVVAAGMTLAAPASASPAGHTAYLQGTVTSGVARPASAAAPALAWKSWTFNDIHSGDCTMFGGATWTFYSDGTASFDGTVTSSDNGDVWLMWVYLADANNAQIGQVANANPNTPDPNEFAEGLPDHNLQYRWLASGRFPANWFNVIQNMWIKVHC